MFTIQPEHPRSKEEILSCLALLQKETDLYLQKVPVTYFFTHNLGGWSVAENLSHLSFSTNILSFSLRIPLWINRILYGKTKNEKKFLTIKNEFRESNKFPQDAGFYSPAIETSPPDSHTKIQILIKEWNLACLHLTKSLEPLSEKELSQYRLKHHTFGKMSYRECCYLHILHILHHMEKVENKLKNISRVMEIP